MLNFSIGLVLCVVCHFPTGRRYRVGGAGGIRLAAIAARRRNDFIVAMVDLSAWSLIALRQQILPDAGD
jgi:hypothetical protein